MLKTRAIQNLKDAVYDAINAGLFFDEIFQIIAKTLNSYNKENKDERQSCCNQKSNQKQNL